MKLTIIAASGAVGRLVLAEALEHGHEVTAVVRDPAKVRAEVRTLACDLAEPDTDALQTAVRGADAVVSCLGPTSAAAADARITTRGTAAIARAMSATGSRRLVVVSAAPVATVPSPDRPAPSPDTGDGFFVRAVMMPILRRVFRSQYADLAQMEDVVRRSELDWTIVRPPRLVDRARTGDYRAVVGRNLVGGHEIGRADLADLLLRLAERPAAVGDTVGVAD